MTYGNTPVSAPLSARIVSEGPLITEGRQPEVIETNVIPAGHDAQAAAPPKLYVEPEHGRQVEDEAAFNEAEAVPAGQGKQELPLPYVPAAHAVQVADPLDVCPTGPK